MTDEKVWVKGGSTRRSTFTVYHTDEDCRLLSSTVDKRQRSLSVLPDGLEECPACAGTVDVSAPEDPFETRNALLEADPDVIGGEP